MTNGAHNSHTATPIKRASRFTMIVNVRGNDTIRVVSALQRQISKLPTALRFSVSRDSGMELARHEQLTLTTIMDMCFCDPHSPWQCRTNENTDGLLR